MSASNGKPNGCAIGALMPFTAQLLSEVSSETAHGGHVKLQEPDSGFLLDSLVARVWDFQQRVFPDQPVKAKLVHLSREVTELRANPSDRSEWADCLILFFGAAAKQGLTVDDLLIAAHQKMDINNERKWGAADEHGVHHHVEEAR